MIGHHDEIGLLFIERVTVYVRFPVVREHSFFVNETLVEIVPEEAESSHRKKLYRCPTGSLRSAIPKTYTYKKIPTVFPIKVTFT